METDDNIREFTDGSGVRVDLDVAQPLGESTALLDTACDRAEAAPQPPVVVLRLGNGNPVQREWPGGVTMRQVGRWERAVRRLERLSAVSIAVARGGCVGPALDLLLAADYRIAAADLRIMLPIHRGHFWPGMALYRLVNQIGVARARQLVLWGHELDVDRALEDGLLDEVREDVEEALEAAVLLLGRTAGPELAIRRQLLLEAPDGSFEENLGAHLAACERELRRAER